MTKRVVLIILSIVLTASLWACSSREKEAEALLNDISMMRNEGNWTEKKRLLNKLISEYSGTDSASEASIKLYNLTRACNKIAENYLKEALSAKDKYLAEHPGEKPDMSKLRQYGFQNSKDIDIKIIEDENGNLMMTSRHISGNISYSVGLPDGKYIKETRE